MPEPDPRTPAQLLVALREQGERVAQSFAALAPAAFATGSDADWSPAHHLEHLTLAHTAVARALGAGARLPAHTGAASRRYAEVRSAYRAAVAATPAAFLAANPFAPTLAPGIAPAELVQRYARAHAQLCALAETWSESELDARAVSHPLLGPITMREMLLFLLYHDGHHVDRVAQKLGLSPGT